MESRVIERIEGALEFGGTKKDVAFLILGGAGIVASFFADGRLPIDPAWLAIVFCGLPIVVEAACALVARFDVKADMLVSIALVASIVIGEYSAAGIVAFIMQIGGLLEELTVARARAGIERLVALAPRTARIVEAGVERIVPAEEVRVGDVVRVLPGETVPVDGTISAGETSIDQSVMTGESMPVDKAPGDEAFSGTINRFGAFDLVAERVGEDSSIARMARLVQSADAGKAKVVRTADRWATWIVAISLATAVIAWVATGDVIRAVTVLVVFCPCALVLATPTAIMAAIGNATRHSALAREGDALERLAKVTHVAFDKTGTLTNGEPRVVEIASCDPAWDEGAVFRIAAAAELRSEHPLGRAIVAGYRSRVTAGDARGSAAPRPAPPDAASGQPAGSASEAAPARLDAHADPLAGVAVEGFELLLGSGVSCTVDGRSVAVANARGLEERGVAVPAEAAASVARLHADGATVSFVVVDGALAGYVALADTLRANSADVVARLKGQGVVPVLLTGDSAEVARAIAAKVGIEDVHAGCLPEDKLRFIEEREANGARICMVGDGVNDAPALRRAFVGVAMGGTGSDIAVDAADVALVNDGIGELPHLLALSRRTLATIKLNITFAMTLNILATVGAVLGLLNPVLGALVHNVGSVLVIGNSALLLGWKAKGSGGEALGADAAAGVGTLRDLASAAE